MYFYIYLILALCCFVGELFTMEFSLTCVGLGFLGAAYTSFLGYNIWWQLSLFTVVAVTAWLSIRPLALRYLYRKTGQIKMVAQAVVGKPAVVEIAIDPLNGNGRVKALNESWKAVASEPLPVGTPCVVEKLDGVTLFVRKL